VESLYQAFFSFGVYHFGCSATGEPAWRRSTHLFDIYRSIMEDRQTGTVKWFSNEKGYGFIVPEGGGEDLFVHYSEIDTDGFKSLEEDDRVEFSVGQTEKGPNAQDVVVIG